MPSASPYEGIGELKELGSAAEANGFLNASWVLVKVIEKTNIDKSTSIVYVLGKPREGQQQPRQPQPATAPSKPVTAPPTRPQPSGGTSAEQKALESLKWTRFKDGNGEWAFYLNAAGESLKELEPAKALIEKMKANEKLQVPVGKFIYKIKGRFLNRFPVE